MRGPSLKWTRSGYDAVRPATTAGVYRKLSLTAIAVGFFTLGAGIYAAVQAPATGYEVSIYWATPTSFWVACGVALATSIAVAVSRFRTEFAPYSFLLAGTSVLAVAALPPLRGYYFYGLGDSLTHLGWARELAAGASPLEHFYPATHLIAAAIGTLGYDIRYAMLLVVVAFTLLFLLFVPLTVRALTSDPRATVVGAFGAVLLLPVFNVGTSYMFVPFTLGMFLSSTVLFLFVKSTVGVSRAESDSRVTNGGLKALLTLSGLTLLFVHPQVMLDVLIVLGTVVAVQFGARWFSPDHPIASHPSIFSPVVLLGAAFAAWALTHEKIGSAATDIVTAILEGGETAAIVQQRGASLQEIGGSLLELFVKLFLVHTVFSVVVAALLVAVLLGRSGRLSGPERSLTLYLGLGGLVLLPYALVQFVGSVSSFFFRHVGFGMVLITLLGCVGLAHAVRRRPHVAGPALAVGAAVAVVLSVAVLFPSPYIYLPNSHVTEEQMVGYENTFDRRAPGTGIAGVRGGAERYSSAYPGVPETTPVDVESNMIEAGLATEFDRDTYVVVTAADRQREVVAFDEIRYSESDLRDLSEQRRVSRVRTNGQVDVFYVEASADGS